MPERIHDRNLLDALEQCQPEPFEGQVARVAREGRDPLVPGYNGRWNDDQLPALYTALEADTAIAEIRYHLSRQPVFPSRLRFILYALQVSTQRTLKLLNLEDLKVFGVPINSYSTMDYAQAKETVYPSTQAVGAAAAFLEFDGLLVPSARREGSTNLVLFSLDEIGAKVSQKRTIKLS